MGILRLLLTLMVVMAHTYAGGLKIIDGSQAVRVFFVVSGFYMALILSEKYVTSHGANLRLFYSNRVFRILPLLWLVLALDVGVAGISGSFEKLPPGHWLSIDISLAHHCRFDLLAVYALTQVSAFGVDIMHLFSLLTNGTLHPYTGPVTSNEIRGWQPYPMSHVWSISCELVFYALAPALNLLRTHLLILGIIVAIVANFMAPRFLGVPLANVATSFLAPFQLGFFALGIVAYRIYKLPTIESGSLHGLVRSLPVGLMLAAILFYRMLPPLSHTGSLACLYGSVALGIPFLFQWSKTQYWDRILGELSYPVYLSHITVIRVLSLPALHKILGPNFTATFWHPFMVMVGAVLVSWILVQLFDVRIDSWRQRRAKTGGTQYLA